MDREVQLHVYSSTTAQDLHLIPSWLLTDTENVNLQNLKPIIVLIIFSSVPLYMKTGRKSILFDKKCHVEYTFFKYKSVLYK